MALIKETACISKKERQELMHKSYTWGLTYGYLQCEFGGILIKFRLGGCVSNSLAHCNSTVTGERPVSFQFLKGGGADLRLDSNSPHLWLPPVRIWRNSDKV